MPGADACLAPVRLPRLRWCLLLGGRLPPPLRLLLLFLLHLLLLPLLLLLLLLPLLLLPVPLLPFKVFQIVPARLLCQHPLACPAKGISLDVLTGGAHKLRCEVSAVALTADAARKCAAGRGTAPGRCRAQGRGARRRLPSGGMRLQQQQQPGARTPTGPLADPPRGRQHWKRRRRGRGSAPWSANPVLGVGGRAPAPSGLAENQMLYTRKNTQHKKKQPPTTTQQQAG